MSRVLRVPLERVSGAVLPLPRDHHASLRDDMDVEQKRTGDSVIGES